MEFSALMIALQEINDKLEAFEPGDLLLIVDLKNRYLELGKRIASIDGLTNVSKFVLVLSELASLISSLDTETEAIGLLKESNTHLSDLFLKKKSAPEITLSLQQTTQAILPMLSMAGLKAPEIKAPEIKEAAPEPVALYSEEYFSSIVDDKKMLSQLADEVKEHLDAAQYTLIELEYDESNQENINKVFRSFHTIKGSSAFLGLKNFEEVGHEMESLLVLVRDGKLRITRELIDVVFFGIELIRNLVTVLETNSFEVRRIVESYKKINIFDYIKLIRKILSQYSFRKIGEILQEDGKINTSDVRLILDKQGSTQKKFGEIAVEENMITADELKDAMKKQHHTAAGKKVSYVKVSNERLNMLIDIVGELVINQSMLKQVIQNNEGVDNSERTIAQLETITTNIKNLVLSMGMVPIADVFNKLRVVIRNTAQDLNKAVIVEIKGEDTELDRNVIESIYDPLVHMVRNSIDHGIETPDEREKAKKDRIGKIVITAEHRGNGIEISVQDDGKGIDKVSIVDKAVSLGILEEDKKETLSDKEIYNLMFLPGFSTAKKVTEVSGRGVGLDVVKKNVDEIHGKMEINSKHGEFSRFTIKLPLTLAIIEGFVTVIGENKYVFPFNSIEEIIVPEKDKITVMDDGSTMLFNRGIYIPIVMSGSVFNEVGYETELSKSLLIIISHDGKNYGLAVDKIIGKQEIVIKNLGDVLISLSVFSGGTIFGDGTIGFVVDIEGFLEALK